MLLKENPWHYIHSEYWGGPTWSQHPVDSQSIHEPWTKLVEVQWVVAPSLAIYLSTMKPGNFQSCLLDIPYLMTWHSHCWIPYISYETFRSLCINQKLHLQYEGAVALIMFSSDDPQHTHIPVSSAPLLNSRLCIRPWGQSKVHLLFVFSTVLGADTRIHTASSRALV